MADFLTVALLLFAVVALIVGIVVGAKLGAARTEGRVREELREEHAQALEDARKAGATNSRRTMGGQVAEKLAPHMPDFPFDPTELRYLGTPIDYVVFRGLANDKVEEIVFLEVKSGKSPLSKRERAVRNAVKDAKIRWDEYRLPSFADDNGPVAVNPQLDP